MRAILIGCVILAVALPGSSLGIATEGAVHWYSLDPVDLNLFVGALNGAIDYFTGELGATGDIPRLARFDHALGAAVGEDFKLGIRLGVELSFAKAEIGTTGTLVLGDQEYGIDLRLGIRNARFGLKLEVPLLLGLLAVDLSGGLSYSEISYSGRFPVPEEEWTLTFIPPTGEVSCAVSTFYLGLSARVDLRFFSVFGIFVEAGWHWQPTLPLICGGAGVDLNGDGVDDRWGFTGVWLGGGIQLVFSL